MQRLSRTLPLLLVALSFPSALSAQDWSQPWADPDDRPPRLDVSGSIGFLAPTDWSDLVLLGSISSRSGVLEQVLVRDLRVEADKEYGGSVTYWRGRYGLRVNGGFSRSSMSIGTSAVSTPVDVDTWIYDIGGAIGFLDYDPTRWVWPYGFFGFGGITYDLSRRISPPFTLIEGGGAPGGGRDVVFDDSQEFLLAIEELEVESVFAFHIGIATDFRIPMGPAGVGLRVEMSDHIAASPVSLRISDLRRSHLLASDTGVDFGAVHHLRASAGFVIQFGR
jgi:hypothetical protein